MSYDIEACDQQGLLVVTHQDYLAAFHDPTVYPYRGGMHGALRLIYVIGLEVDGGSSALPPPSLQSRAVIAMYAERDRWTCHLCGQGIDRFPRPGEQASPDHLNPRSHGGSDYPSNVRTSHLSCNKSRRDRSLLTESLTEDVVSDSLSYRVVTHDRKGREGKGVRKGGASGEARNHRRLLYAVARPLPIVAAAVLAPATMDARCARLRGGR